MSTHLGGVDAVAVVDPVFVWRMRPRDTGRGTSGGIELWWIETGEYILLRVGVPTS